MNETLYIKSGLSRHNEGAIIEITKKENHWIVKAKLITF